MSWDAMAVPLRGFPGKPVGGSRSATASPGCSERGGGWGAMSGPPNFLAGELADLDVDPTVELLALLARVVAQGTVLPDGNDLDPGLRSAEIDQELLDGLRAPLRQNPVVFGRALAIGVALDEHHPGARPVDDRGRVLKNPDGIGPEAGALEVEVNVGVDDTGVGRGRDGSPPGRRRPGGRGRDGARPGRGLLRGP